MYAIAKIAEVIHGKFIHKVAQTEPIKEIAYDSRRLGRAGASLFFAIKSERNNGHAYLEQVYADGVRNFVVSDDVKVNLFPEANILKVKDTLLALQALARYHRQQFPNLPVIGITGSNGKTMVKEWLFQLLAPDYRIVRSPKSYNSQIGVPLSIWQIEPSHDLGIFEAGISKPKEMANLEALIQPQIGIFTNIGDAHNEGFDSMATKVAEKMQLFRQAKTLIYCRDTPKGDLINAYLEKHPVEGQQLIGWSFEDEDSKALLRSLSYADQASQENALHGAALLRHLGYDNDVIAKRLSELQPVALRLEVKLGNNGCLIINDAYNADITSLTIALDFLKQQSAGKSRTVILSDLFQTGKSAENLYAEVASLLQTRHITKLIGIGTEVQALKDLLPNINTSFFETTLDFIRAFDPETFRNECILLKGARHFRFEQLLSLFERKAHRTVLEINLNAIAHNYNVYKSLLSPATQLIGMVKAAGYGSNSVEVARVLEYLGVAYLAVAYTDEGVELRKAGIRTPVMVLNPEESSFDALLRHNLEPEIYSLPILRAFSEFVKKTPVQIHLKVETGMHRLGFEREDVPELIDLLKASPHFKVSTIFSHLAASDATEHDLYTHTQAENFEAFYDEIVSHLGYRPRRHLLNSGGIPRFTSYHYDLVRLGIGLYGVESTKEVHARLEPVSTLKATISQIKTIKKGETVGYNRMGKALEDMRIATISIGYADGLLRRLSNGNGEVVVRGCRAPIFGNICMDMTMIDVTKIPTAREGDEVIIFGKELPVQELAQRLGTIPYEVFTSVSDRVTRICFQE